MPWVKLAKISDVPDGEVRSFSAGSQKIAVAHLGSEFFAIADACTHAQCSLGEGSLVEGEVECPCHGSRFDVATGAVRSLPASVPVPTYRVRVEGKDIYVDLQDG